KKAATATRPRTKTTRCGSRRMATSASSSIPSSSAKLPASTTAPTAFARRRAKRKSPNSNTPYQPQRVPDVSPGSPASKAPKPAWGCQPPGTPPAGVECWNGIRAIDYLVSRPDVDADKITVTGISGGGAATFWIAAADERVACAVPVSGMSDLESYVTNKI